MNRLSCLVVALFALIAAPAAAQNFPELTGRVVDTADIISDGTEAQLTSDLEALEANTQRQLVVATVSSLEGYPIEDYALRLARQWELGDAERNDGVLLLIAPTEREMRIEVGYGLEGVLTDAYTSIIIRQDIVPYFRDGDMEGGIMSGTNVLTFHLGLSDEEAMQVIAESQKNDGPAWWVLPLVMLFPFVFLFVIISLAVSFASGGQKWSGSTSGRTRVSTYSSGSSWSSSSSSFSSGSSSFSGGGGSFGGGGASGSW